MSIKGKTDITKWRWLGLIPIAIWLYNLIISVFVVPNRFGPQYAECAWEYVLWSCPLMGLVLGLGILLNNRFLTGAGALWGIFPVFLSELLMISPAARELAASQGFSIPFLKLLPEFKSTAIQWVGESGVTLVLIEEFATHWIGNFLFGMIGLALVGISRWSFVGTAASFLFTAWFTGTLCPFSPPSPPDAPSLFFQAIPMTIIWAVFSQTIFGLRHRQDKRQKAVSGVLALYWLIAVLLFHSFQKEDWLPQLILGFFILFVIGKIVVDPQGFVKKLGDLWRKRVKWIIYLAFGYFILFTGFFFVIMRPTLINEGGNPLLAYILFGLFPLLLLLSVGLFIVPLLKREGN
jgi:hypothetical protein